MNHKAWAACIATLAVTPFASAASLNLNNYQLSATYGLGPLASEASAVTWNSNTNSLFIIGDEGEDIVEVSKTGVQLSSMSLSGFDDTEGLTYIGGGQFVVAEERLQDLYLLNYTAGGSVSRGSLKSVSLGVTIGNIGIEGVSYDASTGRYIVVKEKSPQGVWDATVDFNAGTASFTDLFVPNLGVSDIGDVQVLSNGNLLIFSQESARLLEVTRTGTVLGSFDFSGIAGNVEGVTVDADGNIFLVGENPELYVLTAVPEPETYALMLLGLAAVGAVARRRA